jgi:DNA repair exonuclease SbcCD ATPase subunit
MRITGWDIKGFGRLKQYKAVPGPGFNIIYAPNESGKSTLQAFIRAMLYGLKGGRIGKDGTLPPIKRYKPWNGENYAGVLEYTLASGESFRVGRNFEKGTTNIYDSGANPIHQRFTQDKSTGPRFAEEHLGLDEATFERSVFLGQMQSAVDEAGRRALIEKIANLNTTGSEDQSLSRAIGALEEALLERVGTGRSSTRPLDKVNMRIKALEEQYQELAKISERYLDSFRELHEKKKLLAQWLDEKTKKEALASRLHVKRLAMIKKEMEDLSQGLDEKERALEAVHEALKKAEIYGRLTPEGMTQAALIVHDMNRIKEELAQAGAALEELTAEKTGLEASLDSEESFIRRTGDIEEALKQAASQSGPGASGKRGMPIPALVAGCLTLAVLGLWLMLKHPLLPVAAMLALAATLFLWLRTGAGKAASPSISPQTQALNKALSQAGFMGLDQYMEYKEAWQKERVAVEAAGKKLTEARNRLKELEAAKTALEDSWRGLTASWPHARMEEGEAFIQRWREGMDNYHQLSASKKAILDGMAHLTDKRRVLVREAAGLLGKPGLTYEECCEALDGLDGLALDETPWEETVTEDELKDLEQRINSLNLEMAALTARLEQAPREGELSRILEELEGLREKRKKLERTGAALNLAKEILLETAKQVRRDYIPALNEEMSFFIGQLTSGKYTRASTNDALQVLLSSPETEALVPVERLSTGTIDQVYLAMRLAAVRLLEKRGEPLPLFLDEPFSQYDEARIINGFKMLKALADERQIFFFTCRERELQLAQKVMGPQLVRIELPD